MKRFNNKGFGHLALLLSLLVLAVVGAAGYYVYSKSHESGLATSHSTRKPSSPARDSSNETSSNEKHLGYLIIKEWGIKIKLEDADKLTYAMHGTPNGTPNADSITSYVTFQLNDSVAAPDACRMLGPSLVQATAATSATKIGNYYYGLEGGYDDCGDTTADTLRRKITNQELVLTAIVPE